MTEEQRAVLAHVVMDPNAWFAHALATFGDARAKVALHDKVARWQASYLADKEALGSAYKTRAERDLDAA